MLLSDRRRELRSAGVTCIELPGIALHWYHHYSLAKVTSEKFQQGLKVVEIRTHRPDPRAMYLNVNPIKIVYFASV